MRQPVSKLALRFFLLMICGVFVFALWSASPGGALPLKKKRKSEKFSSNDATGRLFNILNSSFGGKLEIYLLADIYADPAHPSVQYQRVLDVTYDESLYFGRFTIHVRSVGKMNPQQLIVYTPKQIFDFGNRDTQEFEKINPGPFGATGDLYLRATDDNPPSSAQITDEVRQQYETILNQYIMPAVQKEAAKKP